MSGPVELASLFVQLKRLHARLPLVDVVTAIDETVTNLVGTEDFGVFLRDDQSRTYEKLIATGAQTGALRAFRPGDGSPMGQALVTGQIRYGTPVAVVPLRSGLESGFVGVIVVARLLSHKSGLDASDHAILEVFAEHAGVALEAALCARAGKPEICVRDLRELVGTRSHAGMIGLRGDVT
jgi:hypothetical protein